MRIDIIFFNNKLKKIREAQRKKNLRLSQVKLLEEQLSRLRRAGRAGKAELKRLEAEVKKNIDFVLNWERSRERPISGIESIFGIDIFIQRTSLIKCKNSSCHMQMNADQKMLEHLERDVNIFGGPWTDIDQYGRPIPNSPSYANVAACVAAQSYFPAFHVPQCVYCYRKQDIKNAKNRIANARQEYNSVNSEYTKWSHGTNRSHRKQRSLAKKKAKITEKIAEHQAKIDAYEEAISALEEFRPNAINDFKKISERELSMWYDDESRY